MCDYTLKKVYCGIVMVKEEWLEMERCLYVYDSLLNAKNECQSNGPI